MKIDKLLELQSVIEGRAIPSDMHDDNMPFYYSESKDQHINILFMDLVHVMRVLKKSLETIEGMKEEICELEGERHQPVIANPENKAEKIWNILQEK